MIENEHDTHTHTHKKNLFNERVASARFTCFCININVTGRTHIFFFCAENCGGVSHRYREILESVNPSISNETNEGPSRESNRFTHQTYLYENKCQMRTETRILGCYSWLRTHQRLDPVSNFFCFFCFSCCEIEKCTHATQIERMWQK